MVSGVGNANHASLVPSRTTQAIEGVQKADEAQYHAQQKAESENAIVAAKKPEGKKILDVAHAGPVSMALGFGVRGEDRNIDQFAARSANEAQAQAMRGYNQQRESAMQQSKQHLMTA